MKKFTLADLTTTVIWLLPIVYLGYIYGGLPATVPLHYGIDGKADSYGSKTTFLAIILGMQVLSVLLYLLLKFLPAIDPKKQVKFGEATFQKLALGLVIFLAALNIVIQYATVNHGVRIDKLILPVIGLLFAFIGNVMYNIKPNYFAGIKTPWALENEDNWKATHHMAGKLWFVGGILLTIVTFILPAVISTFVFVGASLALAFIPYFYSYRYFKKHQLDQNS